MAHDTLGPAFWRIGRAAGPTDPRTDADLVTAFVAARCDVAFAELVARHGPVVLGTCRRILGDAPDAEDAFQATFLVLARRASSIRPPGSVGAWLYGVAWKVATKARGLAAKRAARDRLVAKPEAVSDPMTDPTLRPLLDAELARLPDALRTVVVLCDLGGKSRAEAAKELGWPEGTVATRLAKGRAALASRLAKRGVTLTVAGLTTAISSARTSALVPSDLFESTLTATAAATGITPAAVSLANGAARAMTLAKLIPASVVVLVGGLVLAGAAALPSSLKTNEEQKTTVAKTDPPTAPPAKAEEPSGWKEADEIKLPGWLAGSVAYTPDGKTLIVGGSGGHVHAYEASTGKKLWEYLDDSHFAAVAVSHDGKTVAKTFVDGVRLLDAKTGKEENDIVDRNSVPIAVAFFPDVTVQAGGQKVTRKQVIYGQAVGYSVKSWMNWPPRGGISLSTNGELVPAIDPNAVPLAVAPDGTRVVLRGPYDKATKRNVLWAWAAGSGLQNHLLEGHKAAVVCAAWSADGKTIVTGDAAGMLALWDATTFKMTSHISLGERSRIVAVALTDDGNKVASATIENHTGGVVGAPTYTEVVHIWDVSRKTTNKFAFPFEKIVKKTGTFQGLAGLTFSAEGKELAAGFCNFDHLTKGEEVQGTVRTWKLAEKDPPPPIPEHSGSKELDEISITGWLPGSLAYTPDGKTLIVGGSGGHVRMIDTTTRQPRWEKNLGGKFAGVNVSPDGKMVGATVKDGVQLFDAANGVPGTLLEEKDTEPLMMGFFPNTTLIPAAGNYTQHKLISGGKKGYVVKTWIDGGAPGTLRVSTSPTGKSPADPYAVPLAIDPQGRHAVITGPIDPNTGKNVLWAYACGGQGGNHLLEGHNAFVTCAAWSADGNTIVTGDAGGRVIVWNATTFKMKDRIELLRRVCALAITADGTRVAAAAITSVDYKGIVDPTYQERFFIWNVPSSNNIPLSPVDGAKQSPNPFASYYWNPMAMGVVGAAATGFPPGSRVETTPKRLPIQNDRTLSGRFKGLAGLAFSPDGKELAAGFCNFDHLTELGEVQGTVRVWKLVEKEPAPPPNLVVGEGRLTLWAGNTIVDMKPDGSDLQSTEVRNETLIGNRRSDGALLSPDGTTVALMQITKWLGGDDLQGRLSIVSFSGKEKAVNLAGYVPRGLIRYDGNKAYFYGAKGDVWDREARKVAANYTFDAGTGAVTKLPIPDRFLLYAISPDGKWLLYTGPKTDKNGTTLRTYIATTEGKNSVEILDPNHEVSYVAISPDGKRIVAKVQSFDELKPDGTGKDIGIGFGERIGLHAEKTILIDVATKKLTEIDLPKPEYLRALRWNPAGTKIAYVRSRFIGEASDNRIVQPGDHRHDFKIVVADPDGSNAKVVYEATTEGLRDFLWK